MRAKLVQVSMFETSDGSHFATKEDAEKYETKEALKVVVRDFHFYDMGEDDIVAALIENADRLREIFGAI